MLKAYNGKGGIIAKVICDSISTWGKRITTYELEYPRFIHAEFLTHRLFSRNSASSRAIPSEKIINLVMNSPALPIHWGKNQSGMQAYEEHNNPISYGEQLYNADEFWQRAKESSVDHARAFSKAGYHKQITNRLVEPFQMIKVVVTATEYENFYWLRNHHAAQPEIKELAECMFNASNESKPILRIRHEPHGTNNMERDIINEYHLPYVTDDEKNAHSLDDIIKLAVARCAAVSYRNNDYQLEKSRQIYDRLVGDDRKHSSALEHIARVMHSPKVTNANDRLDLEEGISHIDREGFLWSGNFKGWIQYRKLINNECIW
jgi:thymidylate synthase ThyX